MDGRPRDTDAPASPAAQAVRATHGLPVDGDVVADGSLSWLAEAGGLCAWAAAIYPAVAFPEVRGAVGPWWWAAVIGFVVVEIAGAVLRRPSLDGPVAMAQVALFLSAVVAAPSYGLNGILTVVAIVGIAFEFALPVGLAVAGLQTVVFALGMAMSTGLSNALAWAVAYGGLQLFALVMVEAVKRETQARTDLAAAQVALSEARATEERLRIARDLHDQVGHQLTALAVTLEAAAHVAVGTPAEGAVTECRELARRTLVDVRAVVGGLRETPTTGDALARRLRELGDAVPGTRVVVGVDGVDTLPPALAGAVERAAQEIVTNAVRHGQAATVDLDVHVEEGELVLRGVDDGHGPTGEIVDGNGLTGMKERFGLLGGLVTTTPGDDAGVRVVARAPVVWP